MEVAALVLTDQNNAIGKKHIILKYLPRYINYFMELTGGAPIIMGKRTFENVGPMLDSRRNIVVTPNEKYHSIKAKTFPTLNEALIACKREKRVFVMGGTMIFRKALPHTTAIYRTCVKARFKSESFYPEIDMEEFELESAECINADENNRFDLCIEKWVRKK